MPAVAGEAGAVAYSSSGFHGGFNEKTKKEKASPTGRAGQELYAFAGILTDINNIIKAKGADLATAIGGLVDKFAPGWGSLISAGASLFDTLFGGGDKKVAIDGSKSSPIPTYPSFLSMAYAANPINRQFRGDAMLTGAALNINIGFKGDAKSVFTAWVGGDLAYQNQLGGVAY